MEKGQGQRFRPAFLWALYSFMCFWESPTLWHHSWTHALCPVQVTATWGGKLLGHTNDLILWVPMVQDSLSLRQWFPPWIITPCASHVLSAILSCQHWASVSLPSPGPWPDWIKRQTWCTWRCGLQMDVSAASTRLGPGISACGNLSSPNLHFNGLGRWKALSSITAISILISQSEGEASGPKGTVSLK